MLEAIGRCNRVYPIQNRYVYSIGVDIIGVYSIGVDIIGVYSIGVDIIGVYSISVDIICI